MSVSGAIAQASASGAQRHAAANVTRAARTQVVLLGTGAVGRAWLERTARLRGLHAAIAGIRVVAIANSRAQGYPGNDSSAGQWLELADRLAAATRAAASFHHTMPLRPAVDPLGPQPIFAPDPDALLDAFDDRDCRVVVDATASDAVARRHAGWLAAGIHVVTACKLAAGSSLQRWQDLDRAQRRGGTVFGDSATVGAGLPILRTLRELVRGGDRVRTIAGCFSGSLGWLFSSYDGRREFSELVHEARARQFTEPDPRDDLSGEDVRRKLLILARAGGVALRSSLVEVESLVPPGLERLSPADALDALGELDGPLRHRLQLARRDGRVLRHVARFDAGRARVALEALAPGDPLAQANGCDNRVALWTDRYAARPLVIQGPGAGAEVTAAALLDDVLSVVRSRAR